MECSSKGYTPFSFLSFFTDITFDYRTTHFVKVSIGLKGKYNCHSYFKTTSKTSTDTGCDTRNFCVILTLNTKRL